MASHIGMLAERQVSGTLLGVDKAEPGDWAATFELDDGEMLMVNVMQPVGRWLLTRQENGCVEFGLKFAPNGSVVITDDDGD